MSILHRLLPRQIDNAYKGHPLGLWLFVPPLFMKVLMGINVSGINPLVSSRHILVSVDGVPVDTFPLEAQSITMLFFTAWGLSLLVIGLLGLVALLRYRAMIPLMYLALTMEQVGRMVLSRIHAGGDAGEPGGISLSVGINWGLAAMLMVGFALSLVKSSKVAD